MSFIRNCSITHQRQLYNPLLPRANSLFESSAQSQLLTTSSLPRKSITHYDHHHYSTIRQKRYDQTNRRSFSTSASFHLTNSSKMSRPQEPLPTSQVAWQLTSPASNTATELKLNQTAPVPELNANRPNQTLIKILSTSLNPVDYKLVELSVLSRLIQKFPHTPGQDFVGRVWKTTLPEGSGVKPGDLVFGTHSAPGVKHGTLGQYIVTTNGDKTFAKVPADNTVDLDQYSMLGIAAMTAYQSLSTEFGRSPGGGQGKSVFINGGSGGTGSYGIQLAKHVFQCDKVVVSCSGANTELVTSLGADKAIDYKQGDVAGQLREWIANENQGKKFDLIIDNVFNNAGLYFASEHLLNENKAYAQVGGEPGLKVASEVLKMLLWPRILGGGKRKVKMIMLSSKKEEMESMARWVAEGKVKGVVDEVFDMEDASKAFARLKSGRTRGKVVVRVSEDGR